LFVTAYFFSLTTLLFYFLSIQQSVMPGSPQQLADDESWMQSPRAVMDLDFNNDGDVMPVLLIMPTDLLCYEQIDWDDVPEASTTAAATSTSTTRRRSQLLRIK
jgi:hypothetical protein